MKENKLASRQQSGKPPGHVVGLKRSSDPKRAVLSILQWGLTHPFDAGTQNLSMSS